MSLDSESRRIPLRISNKKAYVWDVDGTINIYPRDNITDPVIKEDIASIRVQHRLCGVLTGTLPHLSQQNVFLGIPLVLMPEEVVLLVETGSAALVDDPKAHVQPSIAEVKRWKAEQQESIKTQITLIETKSAKESVGAGRALSEEAQRKRKERGEKKKLEAYNAVAASSSDDGPIALPPSQQQYEPSDSANPATRSSTVHPPKASPTPYTILVPAASSSLDWYDSGSSYTTIELARAAGVWDYPSTVYERARCGVFQSLWEQGYFMGGGIKFGGDYLVYPGDPLRYHSHFAATVLESPTTSFPPMEVVAHGRLGTATKKAHLLCGWDDEKKEVSYMSIEWAGFG